MKGRLGQFLDKYYIILKLGFQDHIDNKIVFLYILQEDLDILNNHWLSLLTIESIN